MTLPQSAADHYREQQRLAVATVAAVRSSWSAMGSEFDGSWAEVGPRVVAVVSGAQLASARQGADSVSAILAETGQPDEPVGRVNPRAFVGVSPSGESLAGLLAGGVVQAKRASAEGFSAREALARGGRWLDMVVHTVVSDASRGAAGVGVIARPKLGYVRMLNPPSCSRCAILAGKWFRANQGFQRHPSCDCRHIPAQENVAGDFWTDPREYFDSLPPAEQDRIFTAAGAQAIRDGADMGRVVNARSGMNTAATPSGRRVLTRNRRGDYRAGSRLMPESIYERASSREEAVALLRANGFIRN